MARALIIVDMQEDFINGALAVPEAESIVQPIAKLAKDFTLVVTTQDWHPPNHASFEAQGGPFPPHCIAGTPGAALHPAIAEVFAAACYKGRADDATPAMNAFEDGIIIEDALGQTFPAGFLSLERWLRKNRVTKLVVVGLTGEFCVPETAIGGKQHNFEVVVPLAYTVPLDEEAGRSAVARMTAAGVRVV